VWGYGCCKGVKGSLVILAGGGNGAFLGASKKPGEVGRTISSGSSMGLKPQGSGSSEIIAVGSKWSSSAISSSASAISRSSSPSSSSSSSLMFMKLGTGTLFVADGDACLQGPETSVIGANRRLLPSSAASASERLYLRTRVDTVEDVATEERRNFGFHVTPTLEGGRTGGGLCWTSGFGGGGVR